MSNQSSDTLRDPSDTLRGGGIDATLVAATPAQLVAPRPREELYETFDRPVEDSLAEARAAGRLALDQTRPSHPGALVGPVAAPPRFGRFAVLRTLGEGGMGVVYAAYDEELDRRIAVKVLRDAAQDPNARDRMVREAQAMARLSHPNVVQVHEINQQGGQIYVAMEFVKGLTLRAWLSEQARSWREIRDMFVQAGRGLAAAHAEGLVHRDFKPDNVLIGNDGRARVADFGLAGTAGQQPSPAPESAGDSVALRVGRHNAFSTALTMAGTIMGTPAYMSPEQHRGEATDARSDQFSFCVALWTALYRQQPFAGDNLLDLADTVCSGQLVKPPASEVPAFIHDALVRGLATEPAQRHPSMDALLDALTRDLVAARPSRWRSLAVALAAAAVAAVAVLLATRERPPSAEELAHIAQLAADARAAGSAAHWVYPPASDPKDTSILRVVALDRTEGPAERPARDEAQKLREEFADALAELGDTYWDTDAGKPFARDFYSQALVFQPDHPRARERGLYTPGQMAELLAKAERGEFTAADLAAAELLEILADHDRGHRDERLRKFVRERGAATQKELLAALLGPDALRDVPQDMPAIPADPAPAAAPEPTPEPPPVVAALPTPEPPATRPRPGKPEPKVEPRPAPPPAPAEEPEEQLAQAAQDRARSDELTQEGEAARRRGDFAAAERAFNQALAAYNRNGAALMGLSDVEFDRGHFEQAVVFAERAVKAEPKKGDFRIRLGDAYFKVLRYPDAKAQYDRAAELGHAKAAGRLDKVKEKIGG
ncbi:Serine/threonine protein kinase [Nannocystis exedens]|uniref:Serine/threonine protein kinase n=1 Tax=Nannocystis exedens TaxID=54 RepID=A0A1I2EI28_9BACT|nr:serine/threonine-protein kinase [Nannocystis exedens]PCC74729.1 serine/threonine protein kinase [Nannocystis exedens]SFE91910.1 Serine/threonine protein kinase [Nannocystis exedens]